MEEFEGWHWADRSQQLPGFHPQTDPTGKATSRKAADDTPPCLGFTCAEEAAPLRGLPVASLVWEWSHPFTAVEPVLVACCWGAGSSLSSSKASMKPFSAYSVAACCLPPFRAPAEPQTTEKDWPSGSDLQFLFSNLLFQAVANQKLTKQSILSHISCHPLSSHGSY